MKKHRKKTTLVLFSLLFFTGLAQAEEKSPCAGCKVMSAAEIADEVENEIDKDDCGLREMTGDLLRLLKNEGKQKMIAIVDNALEQFDMQCLSSLLDSGFGGTFPIPTGTFNLCEYARDWIEDQGLFVHTPQGIQLRSEIEKTLLERERFKQKLNKDTW